jgi:hypothetical protein
MKVLFTKRLAHTTLPSLDGAQSLSKLHVSPGFLLPLELPYTESQGDGDDEEPVQKVPALTCDLISAKHASPAEELYDPPIAAKFIQSWQVLPSAGRPAWPQHLAISAQ